MEPLTDYVYSPLDDPKQDIRLLELLPGDHCDPIRVRILHVPLTKPIPGSIDACTMKFEALSYTWGSNKKVDSVIVEQCKKPSSMFTMAVTANLMSALLHLRDPTKARKLWIDALCLNQGDDLEISQQLPRMRDIYRLAYRVVAWLGPEGQNTKLALLTLESIARESHDVIYSSKSLEKFDSLALEIFPDEAAMCEALYELFTAPWFKRLWVIQELQLANDKPGPVMQWGRRFIRLYTFRRAMAYLALRQISLRTRGRHMRFVNSLHSVFWLGTPFSGLGLQDIFRLVTPRNDCFKPQDRVYELLGLTSKAFADQISISYDKTAAQVYRDALLTHTHITGRLELLPETDISLRHELKDSPSWIPDRSARSHTRQQLKPQFSTSNTRAHIKYNDDYPEILQALGVYCAVIDSITDPLPLECSVPKAVLHVRDWAPENLDTAQYSFTGESLRRAYAMTLTVGRVKGLGKSYVNYLPIEEWESQADDYALFGPRASARCDDSMNSGHLLQHTETALNMCRSRLFFQTKEGYIGLAPRDAQKGDIIAILLGCLTPVVLRPIRCGDNGRPRFSYINRCFVYGLSYSLKLLGPLPPLWRATEVVFYDHRYRINFQNTQTGEETIEDPRLEPLAEEWQRFSRDRPTQDDPIDWVCLRHKRTGEEITFDPRLEPERSRARGVELTWFTLA